MNAACASTDSFSEWRTGATDPLLTFAFQVWSLQSSHSRRTSCRESRTFNRGHGNGAATNRDLLGAASGARLISHDSRFAPSFVPTFGHTDVAALSLRWPTHGRTCTSNAQPMGGERRRPARGGALTFSLSLLALVRCRRSGRRFRERSAQPLRRRAKPSPASPSPSNARVPGSGIDLFCVYPSVKLLTLPCPVTTTVS